MNVSDSNAARRIERPATIPPYTTPLQRQASDRMESGPLGAKRGRAFAPLQSPRAPTPTPMLLPSLPKPPSAAESLVTQLRALGADDAVGRNQALDALATLADTDSQAVRQALCYKFGQPRHTLLQVFKVLRHEMGKRAATTLFGDLFRLAHDMRAQGKNRVVIINATFSGGGVAELFQTCAEILRHLQVEVEWHTTQASDLRFGEIGRKAFDVLQGNNTPFTDDDFAVWERENARLARILQGISTDPSVAGVFLEDHHPVHLIGHFQEQRRSAGIEDPLKLVWRSHVDNANLLAKSQAPMQLWERVIKPQLQRLGAADVALFQPGSVPDDAAALKCGVFTQPPGINPLAVKNQRITRNEMAEILGRVAPGVAVDKPYLVTGGRYVGWKGLLPLLRAHRRLLAEFPDINHLVFGALGTGDARKTQYFGLIEAEVRNMEKDHPQWAGRLQVVKDQNDDIRAFYAKAAFDHMPFCQMSLREGFGMMADEATCQDALPMTTLQGGLSRFEGVAGLEGVPLDISDLTQDMGDPANWYSLDAEGRVVSQNPVADALEERLANHLRGWFTQRAQNPKAYDARYSQAAHAAHAMTLDACNVAMTRAYLAMTMASKKNLQQATRDRQEHEVAAPSGRLVEYVQNRLFRFSGK